MNNKFILSICMALALLPISQVFAASDYITGNTYIGGDQVCYDIDLYKAKWWAGPDDAPSDVDVVAQAWETPWERVQVSASECSTTNPGNQAPVVQAFATPSTPDPSGAIPVELRAQAVDAESDPLSYQWIQLSSNAPSVTIENADMAMAQAVLPEATQKLTYIFQVTVSDGYNSTSTQLSLINEPASGNQSPIAHAAVSLNEISGGESVTLSAVASSDPDGDLLSYQWQQISPTMPVADIIDPLVANTVVAIPTTASNTSFIFEVLVSDGTSSATASVTVTETVDAESITCDSWNMASIYLEGDLAEYNGEAWRAHWWTQGETPGTTGEWGVWRLAEVDDNCNGSEPPVPNPTPVPNPEPNTTVIPITELQATEQALTSSQLMTNIKASIRTLDNNIVNTIAPNLIGNPNNVKLVESIVSESDWDFLFPRRAPEYTYDNFLKAIGKFPGFCGEYDDGRDAEVVCRKSLATMFAHFTQETGGHTNAWVEPQWRQGLVYVRELGWSEDMANGYGLCDLGIWQGERYPCATFAQGHPNAGQFKSYFGRGAKQLSYNYNYGPFSEAMYGDVETLLNQPNLVADTWLNLASAIFFYVYPQPPKPSMLHALDGSWVPNQHDKDNGLIPGFGVTTQIINGGVECGGATEHLQSQNRINYYLEFTNYLNVPVPQDEVLGCASMLRFDTQGSGALNIYWEQDWGQDNTCKLVNYQTPFSALTKGQYADCVVHYFDVEIDYNN